MSNKNLAARVNLAYVTPGNQTIRIPEIQMNCPYQSYNVAVIDVPDAAIQGATYDLPFGAVANPSVFVVKNDLDQDITITITSDVTPLAVHTIPAGGVEMFLTSALDSEILTSVQIALSAAQVGDGSIECFVFGDAVAP